MIPNFIESASDPFCAKKQGPDSVVIDTSPQAHDVATKRHERAPTGQRARSRIYDEAGWEATEG